MKVASVGWPEACLPRQLGIKKKKKKGLFSLARTEVLVVVYERSLGCHWLRNAITLQLFFAWIRKKGVQKANVAKAL